MRALALFSGGLDSVLAMKLIIDQGIEVTAIHVNIGFGGTHDRTEHLKYMCDQVGAKLEILDLRDDYLKEVLLDPKYGYGKNFNPCIDCHGFMFRHTGELLKKYNADFMISGEVMGQRPMSQRKEALVQVQGLSSGYDDLIVRPLCAKHLKPSKPEREGWIDREKLLDIEGRGRKVQLAMAQEIGLKDYDDPAGGCLLTESAFSQKLKDFVKFEELEVDDINTLKAGRHLRLPDGAKLIIGRNKEDNEYLQNTHSKKMIQIKLEGLKGPLSLFSKDASASDRELAARLILTYTKAELNQVYSINFEEHTIEAQRFDSKDEAIQYMVL